MSNPPFTPRPRVRPRPAPGRRPAAAPAPKWGWLEWFAVSQTLLPALLFLPGVSAVRPVIRVASYGLGVLVWLIVSQRPRPPAGPDTFAARSWLTFCIVWLVLMIGHPGSYSLPSAAAQVILYVAVMSPAFWAGSLVETPRQLTRLIAILFVLSALSSLVGIGQVYRPERFNPPYIPAMMGGPFGGEDMVYEGTGGQKIMRPCGLTDTPGGAAPAGSAAALFGLCFALRPIGAVRRTACLGLAFVGVAVIYYTQIRSVMLMLVLSFAVLIAMLLYRGHVRSALTLVTGGLVMVVGALGWVARTMGAKVFARFGTLFSSDTGNVIYASRGGFVQEAFEKFIWQYPLGYGMGWWGMMHSMFHTGRISTVWVEIMISGWIFDGGIPLLVGYCGAIGLALHDAARIAMTSRDDDLQFWAAVVLAYNVSVAINCFSFVSFLSPQGVLFWLLAAALHAADARSRGGEARPGRRPRRWGRPRGAVA